MAAQSCQQIRNLRPSAFSGVYWLNLKDNDPSLNPENAIQMYCEMDTNGGGLTLAYSYGFTNYSSFADGSNAVTLIPNWQLDKKPGCKGLNRSTIERIRRRGSEFYKMESNWKDFHGKVKYQSLAYMHARNRDLG